MPTLLMEAVEASHRKAMLQMLMIAEVEEIARDWAIERGRRRAEPAAVVFCPIKCESYFSDNGGRRDMSADLSRRFHDAYYSAIKGVKDEAPHATLLYMPIDTIGCVEVQNARWRESQIGWGKEFEAWYRIREPRRISRVGAADLVGVICRHLVEGRRALDARDGEILAGLAAEARASASLDQGFFRNVGLWLTSERAAREHAAWSRSREAETAWGRVAALDAVVRKIAEFRVYPRAEVL